MQRLTSDEQLEQIWNLAIEAGIAPVRTQDRDGDPFTIFDSWDNVEAVAELICVNLPEFATENAPSWEHLEESKRPNPYHHIEWAIGEFGFSDQYSTCDNCYTAIDTCDYQPDHYWDYDLGVIMCGDCVRKDKSAADDYLSYMARKLEEEGQAIIKRLADPLDHGFVCLNSTSAMQYVSQECEPDHPAYSHLLTYYDGEAIGKFAKFARLTDERLQIVYEFNGGSNLLYARWNTNASFEVAHWIGLGEWREVELSPEVEEDKEKFDLLLGYALTVVFRRFHNWKMSGGK